jgi:hypothetical protein
MAQTNASFALLTLSQWCRNHGIYEIRDVLGKAADLAAGAESSELLAQALEEAAAAADVEICPMPEAKQDQQMAEPVQRDASKGRRRARKESGQLKGDDPATPGVNEAWIEPGQGE